MDNGLSLSHHWQVSYIWWFMDGLWMVYGWFMDGLWMVYNENPKIKMDDDILGTPMTSETSISETRKSGAGLCLLATTGGHVRATQRRRVYAQ